MKYRLLSFIGVTLAGTLLLSLLAWVSARSSHAAPPPPDRPLVLVTTFTPFGSAFVNQSHKVGREVARQAQDFEVALCSIPTSYGRATRAAMNCLAHLPRPPAAIVGLGEGFCEMALETRGHNLDHSTTRDNDDEVRARQVIDPRGPEYLPLGLDVEKMSGMLTAVERFRVSWSEDAGGYVCNHYVYEMAAKLARHEIPKFGFIHVPKHSCETSVKDPEINAALIVKMISGAVIR